ncbi:unnamed protein product [Oppiella nova]|uniref:C2H2-type domain-containing protein n=1 Tax=Oppiella nova TaxID=334625 RepID=A0A7R9M334_9ACAR|nr:unnamed protein product [Oppiella nova]CAG2169318.1 unnamed protein product [Oppiella nova]
MSQLIELNKSQLICKIQSIHRDKHRLKTLLSRHQLLNHFYDKLYHNCIQMNGNRRRSPRKQTNSKLRSTQTQLLSQIRMISECDKSAKVCLPRHPSLDTPVHRLFKEKSTQYQVTDCLSQHIPKEHIKELVECNGITDNGCHHKPDDKSAKCIDIDINEASDGESTPRLDVTVECSNQLMNTKSVGASDAIIHETNGVDNKMSPKDLKCKAIKSFVCSYCDKGYKIKKNLNKHITRTHKYITSESIKTDDMTPNVPELPEVTETKPQIAAKMETTIACQDKHRLKTLLSRHQLLNHFYDKLYHNCIQINGNRRRSHRKQTNSKLRSTQTQLLSQIRMISECDKSAKVCLPRHPSLDTPVHRLFKEKSTQYEVTDCLSQHIPKEHHKELVECNGITGNGCHYKPDDKSAKCIDIDISEASDGESTPRLDMTVECSNQLMDTKSVGASDAIIDETNGVDKKMSPKDLKCKAIKSFVCSYCDKGYKIKKNLDKHITRTHKYITSESIKTDDMTPNVPELPEVTETKPQIKAKMETTIACQWPDCGLTFTNRTQFLRHQAIHSESRKACTECGLRFDDSELLRQHMMYHSNQSLNQFEMKAFKSQMPLNGNHMNHSNGMDYTYGWDSSRSVPQTHPMNDHSEHNTANNRAVLLFCDFPNCHYKTSNCHHLEVHQKRAHDTVYMSL